MKTNPFILKTEGKSSNFLSISSNCQISSGKNNYATEETSYKMIEIGNWHCIINELRRLNHVSSNVSLTRLQKEISEIFEILSYSQNSKKLLSSELALNLRFPCSCITQNKQNYIRFLNVYTKSFENYKIYLIPTTTSKVSIFFIESASLQEELQSEFKFCKTDLFYKVEILLKQNFEKSVTNEL